MLGTLPPEVKANTTKLPYKAGPGFVTEYLPGFPGDWVCIEDFMGRVGGDPCVSVCAWWSPSRHVTSFGGQWWEAPDLPFQASEDTCWRHGMAHSVIGKRIAAEARAGAKWKASMAATDSLYSRWGSNSYEVVVRLPDGSTKDFTGRCGIHGTLSMLRNVSYTISDRQELKGAVITLLRVTNSRGNPVVHNLDDYDRQGVLPASETKKKKRG